ncbi:MAG: L-histidine N(alpha)-methyltransferase, partial [Terriglobales bacterium]
MAQALSLSPVSASASAELLQDVCRGLQQPGQKTLPCKYLYDEAGSLLFEAICALPEYGLTGADERLLHAHAREMLAPFPPDVLVAELGSGSARKTRWILQQLCVPEGARRLRSSRSATPLYWPIEISPRALERSQRELAALSGLEVEPIAADYLDGLAAVARRR